MAGKTLRPLLLVLALAAGCAGGVGSTVDRDEAVAANERLVRELPLYPGARVRETASTPYRASESGPVVGYGTRLVLELPAGAEAPDVAAFYAEELRLRGWQLAERLDGPVLNFSRGAATVSVNLEGAGSGEAEIAVDARGARE